MWGYDGQGIRVWLNALAIESASPPVEGEDGRVLAESVKESVNIPLDFYPLCESFCRLLEIGQRLRYV